MGNELQAVSAAVSGAVATIDPAEVERVVANTIFPNSTPEERAVYYYKCQLVGVHPLSQKITPVKFNSESGPKLTFIVGIDVMRSRAMETGQYDGCDDVDYGDDGEIEYNGGRITVPEEAVVRVYRKDVSRPFVGRARWSEYYPGDKRGRQWREKPYLMLAKCAEAQAYRKAFPEALDHLYSAAEMDMTLDAQPTSKSSKPRVTAAQVVVTDRPAAQQVHQRGVVEDCKVSHGEKDGKAWTRYGVTIGGVTYGTFDADLGTHAQDLLGRPVVFTSAVNGKHNNLTSIDLSEVVDG
jgi:phage recombination protein Bet